MGWLAFDAAAAIASTRAHTVTLLRVRLSLSSLRALGASTSVRCIRLIQARLSPPLVPVRPSAVPAARPYCSSRI